MLKMTCMIRDFEINRLARRGKIILIKGKNRPKNDFYFSYIFHVSKIVSFRLREAKRLLKHFADFRRLPVYMNGSNYYPRHKLD